MSLHISRLRYQKKGFRAKLSTGWFVIDDSTGRPVAGPFDHKSEARIERDRRKGARVMQKKEETTTETTRTQSDQSDSESAKNTNDGSSPTDGREEEVIADVEKKSATSE